MQLPPTEKEGLKGEIETNAKEKGALENREDGVTLQNAKIDFKLAEVGQIHTMSS